MMYTRKHLPDIEQWSQSSGSNVIPRGARTWQPQLSFSPVCSPPPPYDRRRTRGIGLYGWMLGETFTYERANVSLVS